MIHYKNSDDDEEWYKYNSNGNIVRHKWGIGGELYEEWAEKFDSNGNVVHSKNSAGIEKWYEYDNNGNQVLFKNSEGFEQRWKYDSNDNLIYHKDSGFEWWYEYTFWKDGTKKSCIIYVTE